jgi:hypothetical protein
VHTSFTASEALIQLPEFLLMAKILLRLRMAPDDEVQEVKDLLDEHRIPWFETSAGRFGASFPAIWLRDDDDWARARALLNDYQSERQRRIQSDFQNQLEQGLAETFLSRLLSHPLQIMFILVVIAVIGYFSIMPFFSLLTR